MDKQFSTVIIIGGGPAGIACASQLKRHDINSLIFEKDEIGGLLRNANLIENYPGFPAGISGAKFVQLFKKHAQTNDLNILYQNVESVEYLNDTFTVRTQRFEYECKYLVIASGTKPIIPAEPKIEDDIRDKIFCNIYKLGRVQNKTIAIIGAGDCAFDYALQLADENNVLIINRSNRIKSLKILQSRVNDAKNIQYIKNTPINNIDRVDNKLNLISNDTNQIFNVDYLLIAIGRKPNLDFIDNNLLKNSKVFQIGDVHNGIYRQTSIAVGDGTFTAMKINSM